MVCRSCGRTVPDDWKFCMHCGGSLEKSASPVCPKCVHAVQPGDAFCRLCGARLGFAGAPSPYMPAVQHTKPSQRTGARGYKGFLAGGAILLVAAAAVLAVTLLVKGNGFSGAKTTPAPSATRAPSVSSSPKSTASPIQSETAYAPTRAADAPLDTSQRAQLDFYIVGDLQTDEAAVLNAVNGYLIDKINATLRLHTFGWGDYDTKMNPMLASGEPMDLVMTATWMADYRANAGAGHFRELDNLLNLYGVNTANALGEDALNAVRVNGKIYALPLNGAKFHNVGLLLRKDLVDKYNIRTTGYESLADFAPVFAQIKASEPGVYPLMSGNSSTPYSLLAWSKADAVNGYGVPGALYPNGGSADVRILNDYVQPESVALYKLLRNYYQKGYIDPDIVGSDSYYSGLDSGKYFSFVHSLQPGIEAQMKSSYKFDWVQVPLTSPMMSPGDVMGLMLAIPAASENPERAMGFCDLLYSDAYLLNLIDYGIEGKHYVKLGDSTIRVDANAGYCPGNSWKFGNELLTYLLEGEPSDKWSLTQRINGEAMRLNTLGFWFDDNGVSNEMQACRNVVDQYRGFMNGAGTGDVDATVAQFQSELNVAGAETVIAEMQRQYDAWRAAR